jgi:hypothetical protein
LGLVPYGGNVHRRIGLRCALMKAKPLGQYLMEASDVYPDNLIENYFNFKTGKRREIPLNCGGDTLARFIGIEISEVYDSAASDEDNRIIIESALTRAAEDLDKVIAHFRGNL